MARFIRVQIINQTNETKKIQIDLFTPSRSHKTRARLLESLKEKHHIFKCYTHIVFI